jgi:hypothetical protein
MARLPTLPLIGILVAACASPATKNEPQTVVVAKTPSSTTLPPVPSPSAPRARVVVTRDRENDAIWSVSADGKTTRLDWPDGAMYTTGRAGAGSDAPIATLDGKRVAYVRDGARKGPIVIRDLERATSTTVRVPERTETLLADWSSDGRRLLFCTSFLDGPNGAIANPDGSELRFAVYDVVAQHTRPLPIPDRCEYQAWLPSGEVLVTCESGTVLGRFGTDLVLQRIAPKHRRFMQAHVGESGAVAVIADDAVLLLAAGSYVETAGPSGAFADYQFPKPSPSGRRVGYAHHIRSASSGHVRVDLEVDGKKVADDAYDFEWLDEQSLVVLRANAAPSVIRLM